jgi:hypothetical protein
VSILTKLFVVLVTIMAVVLAALIIPYVSNVQEYRGQADRALAAKNTAESLARTAQTEVAVIQAGDSQQMALLKAKERELTNSINALENQKTALEADLASTRAQQGQQEADLTRLTSAVQQATAIQASQEQELKQLRQDVIEQRTRNIQLADANTELESANNILLRQVRVQKENIQELNEQVLALRNTLDQIPDADRRAQGGRNGVDTVSGPPGELPTLTYGKVTAVEDVTGQVFLQINLGRADGVRENSVFRVHRGDTFLGKLTVTRVDDRTAVGQVTLNPGINIAPGDSVQSGGLN